MLITFASGVHPWSVDTYEQKIPSRHGPMLTWTRREKIWNDEEVTTFRERFKQVWRNVFGDTEERITSRHPFWRANHSCNAAVKV